MPLSSYLGGGRKGVGGGTREATEGMIDGIDGEKGVGRRGEGLVG